MQTRSTTGPLDPTGPLLAALVASGVLLGALSFETQQIARLNGYQRAQLGVPALGKLYAPWKSLEWMERYDLRFRLAGLLDGSSLVSIEPRERAWARAAFAAERARLPWEFGGALCLFGILGGAWARRLPTSAIHGGAAWATPGEIRGSTLYGKERGVVLGQTPGGRRLLVHDGSEAVLAIGPPGSGKTDGIAKPTLVKQWKSSAIVFDPAAELAPATAPAREKFSEIVVFDPRSVDTARFNPLEGFAPGDVDRITTVLASFMFDKDPSEMHDSSRFFVASALELGVALVAHSLELGKTHFAAIADQYYGGPWENDKQFFEAMMKSSVPYVAQTGSKFVRMEEELRSSIIGTLTQHLSLFRTDDVARATSASSFSAARLREKSTTLYLVVREKDQRALSPLLRMVLTRLLDDLTERIPAEKEQSVLLMLDEFPLLKAPVIEQKLATARKYRVRTVLLAQTRTQIVDYYGMNESVTGLCDVRVFFPSGDRSTQELASETCGTTTRWGQTTNHDRKSGPTRAVHESARPLLLPHELASVRGIVVWKRGEAPILAQPVRAHKDWRFQERDSPASRVQKLVKSVFS